MRGLELRFSMLFFRCCVARSAYLFPHIFFIIYEQSLKQSGGFVGRPDVQVVWFKRDLRVRDHAALMAAVETGAPVLPLYVFEPSLLTHPHTSPRHVELALDGITDLRESLTALGAPLVVRV